MSTAQLPFPIQFKRQYGAPLDADITFTTEAELTAYLSNPLKYPGQIVSCQATEGIIYVLNTAMTAWISFDSKSGALIFSTTELLTAHLTNDDRSAGQIASCTESPGILFLLNDAMDTWYEFISDQTKFVHTTGDENIAGAKTFENNITLKSSTKTVKYNSLPTTTVTDTDGILKYRVELTDAAANALLRLLPDLITGNSIMSDIYTDYHISFNINDGGGFILNDVTFKYVANGQLLYIYNAMGIESRTGTAHINIPTFIGLSITGLTTPINSSDAIPKAYLDLILIQLNALIAEKENVFSKVDANENKFLKLTKVDDVWTWSYVSAIELDALITDDTTETSNDTILSSAQAESRYAESAVITLTDSNLNEILVAGQEYIVGAGVTIDLNLNCPVSGVKSFAISNKSMVDQTITDLGTLASTVAASIYCTNSVKTAPTWAEYTTNLQ